MKKECIYHALHKNHLEVMLKVQVKQNNWILSMSEVPSQIFILILCFWFIITKLSLEVHSCIFLTATTRHTLSYKIMHPIYNLTLRNNTYKSEFRRCLPLLTLVSICLFLPITASNEMFILYSPKLAISTALYLMVTHLSPDI